MKKYVLAIAALALPSIALAHPGHGTVPASDGGKPHVHFGTVRAPAQPQKVLQSGDKSAVKPVATHEKGIPSQELRHAR